MSGPQPKGPPVESLSDDNETNDSLNGTTTTTPQPPDELQARQCKRAKGLPTNLKQLTPNDSETFTRSDLTDLILNGELQHLLSRLANVLLMIRQELQFCISNPLGQSTGNGFPEEVNGNFFSIILEFSPQYPPNSEAEAEAEVTTPTIYSHHKLYAHSDFYRGEDYPCYDRDNILLQDEEQKAIPSLTILLADGPNAYITELDDFVISNGLGYVLTPEPGWCLSDTIRICLNRAFLSQLIDMHTKASMDGMTSYFDSFSLGKTSGEGEDEDGNKDDDGDISFTKVIEKDNMVIIMDPKVGDMFKYVLEKETPDVIEALSENNMLGTWCNQASHFVIRRSKHSIAYHSITEPEEVHYRQAFKDVRSVELYGTPSQFSGPRSGILHHDIDANKYYLCALLAVSETTHCYTSSGLAWAQNWYNSPEAITKPINEEWEGLWSHCIKEFLYYTILSYGTSSDMFTPESLTTDDKKSKLLTEDIANMKKMFVKCYEPKGCKWLVHPRYTGMCFSLPHPYYNVPYGLTNTAARLDIPVHHAFITMSPVEEISKERAEQLHRSCCGGGGSDSS